MKTFFIFLFFANTSWSRPAALGITPDCGETKITIDQILQIEKRKDVSSMLDFLRNLPSGSLQTFTFVSKSNSFQHHLVNEKWPRVLRFSADGKITMSFVCNPDSQDYGRVEILHYLEAPIAEWRTVSLDFRDKKSSVAGLREEDFFPDRKSRVHLNDPTCAKCHSPSGSDRNQLRPIMPQYNIWKGFYGSSDDVLHLNTAEHNNYVTFLDIAKTDPCFASLPWPKEKVLGYELYPYHEGLDANLFDLSQIPAGLESERIKINNYDLRPNLKLTDAYSHLMSQRLAWKLLKNPDYHQAASLLMMEAPQCDDDFVEQELRQIFPAYMPPEKILSRSSMDPRSERAHTRHLYGVSLYLGLESNDFALHFNRPDEARYNTGARGSQQKDISIAMMAQGVLLREFSRNFPELEPDFGLSRGVSEFFVFQDFSCMDDVAGAVVIESEAHRKRLCENLKKIYLEGRRTRTDRSSSPTVSPLSSMSESQTNQLKQSLLSFFSVGNPILGKSHLNRCTNCHGRDSKLPPIYQFLKGEEFLKEKLKKDPQFVWTLFSYLESGRMPKGSVLSLKDKSELQSYFRHLIK